MDVDSSAEPSPHPVRANRSSSVPGALDNDGLDTIRTNHNEAYVLVAQGLSHEENGDPTAAIQCYQQGLEKMEKALAVRCDRPYCLGERWDSARKMQNKMRRTVQEVRTRLAALSTNRATKPTMLSASVMLDRPPSYEEACGSETTKSTNLVSVQEGKELQLCGGLEEKKEKAGGLPRSESAMVEEIFSLENVHLFHIRDKGEVTTISEPTSLHIFKFVVGEREQGDSRPPAWLQVGDWSYPLVPGQSPVLSCEYGAFIFPDLSSTEKGSSIGVILPCEADVSIHDAFEHLLTELTVLQPEPLPLSAPVPPYTEEKTSYKISKGIVAGARWVSFGLVKGAELAGPLVSKGANMLREKLHPEGAPKRVDPRVQQGIAMLREASGTARKVSGYLVSKLGSLTMAMARELGPHIRKQGTRLISSTLPVSPTESQAAVEDVMIVAAGGLQGFATVYMGLEQAARTLAYSLSQETVKTVDHKYGPDVSQAVENALHSVGNLALTANNVRNLGVKSLAKRTAKDVGKTVLQDYVEKVDNRESSKAEAYAATKSSAENGVYPQLKNPDDDDDKSLPTFTSSSTALAKDLEKK